MKKLIQVFKHIFIPHKHNDYKPHIFREFSVFSITLIVIILFSISLGTRIYINNTDMTAAVLPAVLIDLTNNVRSSNNESLLTRSAVLDNAAKLKAEDMARFGYFAHTSPQGITPWHWFDEAGYKFTYAGENLAINFTESIDVENAWLNSPTHKANILGGNFTEIGVATVDGVYQGYPTTYVVQMFGKPAKAPNTDFKNNEIKPNTIEKFKIDTKEGDLQNIVASDQKVKGESIVIDQNLQTITDTKELIVVKDNSVKEEVENVYSPKVENYSTWYQRLVFMNPSYADRIYKIFILIVLVSLILMMLIEISRKHTKNIIYGVLLLIIIISLVYLNKTMFIENFLV